MRICGGKQVCHLFAGLAHAIDGLKLPYRLFVSYLPTRHSSRPQIYCRLKYSLFLGKIHHFLIDLVLKTAFYYQF
jgi:hypothetical protein